jgi:hypothetical protein
VSDQQARLIVEATESVEISDAKGGLLGCVAHGFTEEDIAAAKKRMASDEPRRPSILVHRTKPPTGASPGILRDLWTISV